MKMTINPETVKTTVVATGAVVACQSIVRLEFAQTVRDIRDAAILLRETVGAIPSLNNSLLGLKPGCKNVPVDLEEHKDARKFMDADGMVDFQEYLDKLTVGLDPQEKPRMDFYSENGFSYMTVAKRAHIALVKIGKCAWRVSGHADFRNPTIAKKNLKRMGFLVRVYQV